MSIKMACPSCGKTLAAPDSAAGKRAKCPSCSQVMIVPGARPAESLGSPTPAPNESASPPAAGGDSSWLDDMGSQSPAGGTAAPESGGEQRRPCPECGEMIVASAAKCRFCGAVFDPRLKARAKKRAGGEDIDNPSAGEWAICILLAGIGCIVGIVYAVQGKPKGLKMVGISVVAAIFWNVLLAIVRSSIR